MCCNFAADQFDADTHVFSIKSCIALFVAVSILLDENHLWHLHFLCSALFAAVNFTESDFAMEQ